MYKNLKLIMKLHRIYTNDIKKVEFKSSIQQNKGNRIQNMSNDQSPSLFVSGQNFYLRRTFSNFKSFSESFTNWANKNDSMKQNDTNYALQTLYK